MVTMQDKLELLELISRYNYFTDTGDAKRVGELFTSDGIFDGPPGRFEGNEAIVKFNVDVHKTLRGAMHFNDNHIFDEGEDCIYHKCYLSLQIPSADGVRVKLLAYSDEIVKVSGEWKFRSRYARHWNEFLQENTND